ncbi:hypothetical protein B0H19DRAFT_1252188 [Mycena capillaripes]|nr:hypothetical protein B0H19DRAFT_1252188 [Mycena capillaripes]
MTEKRRESLLRLGQQRQWPETIYWNLIQYRIADLKPAILGLLRDSAQLTACAVWDEFILAIDYNLDNFYEATNKFDFRKAFHSKRCGYYGPQGELVIYSCLLRLISEFDRDKDQLEQELYSTLHAVVTAYDSQFDWDDTLATSNYLSLDDFTHFILVPFTAASLILDDRPAISTLQDATFEKTNCSEFGELFHLEDVSQPEVDNIHRQNMVAVRSARAEKSAKKLDNSNPSTNTAPPHSRKDGPKVDVKAEVKPGTFKVRPPPFATLPTDTRPSTINIAEGIGNGPRVDTRMHYLRDDARPTTSAVSPGRRPPSYQVMLNLPSLSSQIKLKRSRFFLSNCVATAVNIPQSRSKPKVTHPLTCAAPYVTLYPNFQVGVGIQCRNLTAGDARM